MNQSHRLTANGGNRGVNAGRYWRPAGQGKAGGGASGTRSSFREEEALGQASGTVEQVIVEDRVLVIQSCASANYSFAATGRIPDQAGRRTEVMSGHAYTIA